MATETLTPASSSPWTCPSGVYTVRVQMWGGGGKGGTRTTSGAGGGGGGGAYSELTAYSVTPGNTYGFAVGSGATTTSSGGNTYWVNTSTGMANGGSSTPDNTATGSAGGAAVFSVGDIKYSGGSGANGISGNYGGGGGSSAGTGANGATATDEIGATAPVGGGNGGNGKSGTQGSGSAGSIPGGGGGGALRNSGTRGGGAGANGQIILTYNYEARPSVTNVTTSGYAPTVQQQSSNNDSNPSVGSIALAGLIPTLAINVLASVGGISTTGYAPTTQIDAYRSPTTGTVQFGPQAPTTLSGHDFRPANGSIALTGYTVALHTNIPIGVANLALSGATPTVFRPDAGGGYGGLLAPLALNLTPTSGLNPSVGSLSLTGYTPTIQGVLSLGVGSASFTGYAPTVVRPDQGGGYGGLLAPLALNLAPETNVNRNPTTGALVFTGYTPTVDGGVIGGGGYGGLLAPLALNLTPTSPIGAIYFTGYAPTVIVPSEDLGSDDLVSLSASLSGSGTKGTIIAPQYVYPTTGTVSITGYTVGISNSLGLFPTVGAIHPTGYAPSVGVEIPPVTGGISFTGYAPTLSETGREVTTAVGNINVTGYAPTLSANYGSNSGLLTARRAFLAIYVDYDGSGSLVADVATVEVDTSRNARGDGGLVAGAASLVLVGWECNPTASETWDCQSTASETWTEVVTNTEVWNG